jgi:formate/nitrite transporter FocA (FNT family)
MMLLGFNAGWFLSFGSLAGLVVGGEFSGAGREGMAKFVYALLFPIGLVIIVLAGGELLSGATCTRPAWHNTILVAASRCGSVWLILFVCLFVCLFVFGLPFFFSPAPAT